MGQTQSTYVNKNMPDLLQKKILKKEGMEVVIGADLSRLTLGLSDFEVSRQVPRKNCGMTAHYRYKAVEIESRLLRQRFEEILNVSPVPLESPVKFLIQNQLWAKGTVPKDDVECCPEATLIFLICNPLCCILVPTYLINKHCVDHTIEDVSDLVKARQLMASLKAIDNEIDLVPTTMGLCCFQREMDADKFLVKFALKCIILAEIEKLVHQSLGKLNLESNEGSDYIANTNNHYVAMNVEFRTAKDEVSNKLVDLMGSASKKTFVNNKDFSAACHSDRFSNDWHAAVVNNHKLLTGGKMGYIPANLQPVYDVLKGVLNIVDYTARVKTVDSIQKNFQKQKKSGGFKLPGPIYDMFGMRLFVHEKSLFLAFSLAAAAAQKIATLPNVGGVATSHELKSETSYIDFKIIVMLTVNGQQCFAEIEVIPVVNFISDEAADGHNKHKKSHPGSPAGSEKMERL